MRVFISHLMEDYEMKELIEMTGCGVESIEFSISENLDSLYREIRTYEKRLSRMGCKELTIHGPFLDLNPMAYDKWVVEITRQRYEQAYLAAQLLGAEKIIYHTCYIPGIYMLTGWADRMVDFWNRFMEDKHGIQVLMENVQDPCIEPILEVADRVRHPDFGLCLDVGHANCYSQESVTKWARRLGPHVKHVHLSDNDGRTDSHLALGEGTTPAAEALSCIYFHNPEATCTIECSSREAVLKSWNWLQMDKGRCARTG
ncbi:MAG: sugar phosphate isomerase/epimerase [Lachnospiraceae bacterium]|nr:sugar phosphate isomerase/epimerase [Lachnospiraceae bacterium]